MRAGFLDERGVRWTPTIPLLTGRFGVRVPGGAPSRTGPSRPVLGVSQCRGDQSRTLQAHRATHRLPTAAARCLPSGQASVRRQVAAARRGTGSTRHGITAWSSNATSSPSSGIATSAHFRSASWMRSRAASWRPATPLPLKPDARDPALGAVHRRPAGPADPQRRPLCRRGRRRPSTHRPVHRPRARSPTCTDRPTVEPRWQGRWATQGVWRCRGPLSTRTICKGRVSGR
jgi:hypothetical protein